MFVSLKNNKLFFLTPSKQLKAFHYSTISLNLAYNLKDNKFLASKTIFSKTRGVAMNPNDHHNGGRTNRKALFLNKYNKIAKFHKYMFNNQIYKTSLTKNRILLIFEPLKFF